MSKSEAKDRAAAPERSEAIYLALRQAIMEQALAPGTRLPEDQLGAQFGVSRTLVRQVLERLSSEALIELAPNRGARVAQPAWSDAEDLFAVRAGVERVAIERLARAITPAKLARLERHVDQEDAAKGGDRRTSIRLATEFHLLIAELAGGQVLSRYVDQLALRCGLMLAVHDRAHSADCGIEEHRGIIAALRDGQVEAALNRSDSHLASILQRASAEASARPVDLTAVLKAYAPTPPQGEEHDDPGSSRNPD